MHLWKFPTPSPKKRLDFLPSLEGFGNIYIETKFRNRDLFTNENHGCIQLVGPWTTSIGASILLQIFQVDAPDRIVYADWVQQQCMSQRRPIVLQSGDPPSPMQWSFHTQSKPQKKIEHIKQQKKINQSRALIQNHKLKGQS